VASRVPISLCALLHTPQFPFTPGQLCLWRTTHHTGYTGHISTRRACPAPPWFWTTRTAMPDVSPHTHCYGTPHSCLSFLAHTADAFVPHHLSDAVPFTTTELRELRFHFVFTREPAILRRVPACYAAFPILSTHAGRSVPLSPAISPVDLTYHLSW